jgi:hypothetical protein
MKDTKLFDKKHSDDTSVFSLYMCLTYNSEQGRHV